MHRVLATRLSSASVRSASSFAKIVMNTQAAETRGAEESIVVREGMAEILANEKKVFYNPVQEFNRDLSVAVLSIFTEERKAYQKIEPSKKVAQRCSEGITILEALSATGLRSIRYAKEVPFVHQITANDISAAAVESIKKNVLHNGVGDLVTTSHEDATMVMYRHRSDRFDAVDVDPYGSPSVFLDGAVQCISEGGLLLITATDMAVLAGNSPETCHVKYGAISLKSKACHEMALRILLQHISSHAGRYGRYIQPLISISVDFYIRVFVRVYTGQIVCKGVASKLGMIYQCVGCESITTQPLSMTKSDNKYGLPAGPPVDKLCHYCGHKHHIGGPIWLGPLHDRQFVSQLLSKVDTGEFGTKKRLQGVLNVIYEELDVPLYYLLDRLMSIVKCEVPPMVTFSSALINAGYKVSISHAHKTSVKTDAPNSVIWDIVRAWEKLHPAKKERFESDSAALAILNTSSSHEISFQPHPLANPASRQKKLSRFQKNPTAYWGPGTKSTMMVQTKDSILKKKKNQNKHFKRKQRSASSDESGIMKSFDSPEKGDVVPEDDQTKPSPQKQLKRD
ncbi:probable tRNA (guanine(26)-N(2))-dimethyltransferase [Neodiprion lecontei]|uniref:tRNA (guanine(26)-N(2))-dimethyltransferase n=1 Tax=Neodiprion lecontei TaxID=441921 RepID=A0ABM3G7J3_NEOLC|nr:probable tRNA (guanine(26)-N(2))-dimethyltransferase [Neodiprion lecontei]XP_046596241.1 probable tRNA (guanine(26)-N(2))-dimethyltransferase [Neodiprion lecontei]